MKFVVSLSQKFLSVCILILSANLFATQVQAAAKPVVNITSPGGKAVYSQSAPVTLSATAYDQREGDVSHTIRWQSSRDGKLGIGATMTVYLSEGEHTLTALAQNSRRVRGRASVVITIGGDVDNAPTLTINSPTNNSSFDSEAQISFSGSASDLEDGNLDYGIRWNSNIDGFLGTGGNITANLSAGDHLVTASVSDSADQQAQVAINLSINEPINNLPTLTINAPGDFASFDADDVIIFMAAADDAEDGDISQNIQWHSNIDGVFGSGANLSAILTAGAHVITASVVDSQNAADQMSINLTVSNPVNNAPVVAINSPGNNTTFNIDTLISFDGDATDAEDGDLSSNIQWSSNIDGFIGSGANISTMLTVGTHTVTATVSDSSNASHTREVTVTVEEPASGGNQGVATVSWVAPTLNEDGSPINDLSGFKVYYGTSASDLSDYVVVNDAFQFTQEIADLEQNATYYFAVTAFNEQGVESEYSDVTSKVIN